MNDNVKPYQGQYNGVRVKAKLFFFFKRGNIPVIYFECMRKFKKRKKERRYFHGLLGVLNNPARFQLSQIRKKKIQ